MLVATFVVAASWPTFLAIMLGDFRVGALVLRELLLDVFVVILGCGRWMLAHFVFWGNTSGTFVFRSVFGLPEKKSGRLATQMQSLFRVKHFFCERVVVFTGLVLLSVLRLCCVGVVCLIVVVGVSSTKLLS